LVLLLGGCRKEREGSKERGAPRTKELKLATRSLKEQQKGAFDGARIIWTGGVGKKITWGLIGAEKSGWVSRI